MLEKNQIPPSFSLINQNNKITSLTQYKDKKIVLFFYPKDDTPGCTKEAIEFTKSLPIFEKNNCVVLGISKDNTESHCTFRKKHKISTDLLSDTDLTVMKQYGVWREKVMYGKKSMGVVRTTILINEQGRIHKIWNNVRVNGHVEKVLEEVQRNSSNQ